jgi:hypothetical protein
MISLSSVHLVERTAFSVHLHAARWCKQQRLRFLRLDPRFAGRDSAGRLAKGHGTRKPPNSASGKCARIFSEFLAGRVEDDSHFHKIRYWDSVLSPWAGRLQESLWVKYDPRNLSRLYVRDPNGKHWPVPYADLRQPPIALWQLLEAS